MEYLLFRESKAAFGFVFITLILLVFLFIEIRDLRKALRDRKATRRRRLKERPFPWLNVCVLGFMIPVAAYLIGYGSWRMYQFHLDKTLCDVQQASGIASVERVNPYRGTPYDLLLLDTGEENRLSLHIPEGAVEDGAAYAVTYFPRTMTLCDARKLE